MVITDTSENYNKAITDWFDIVNVSNLFIFNNEQLADGKCSADVSNLFPTSIRSPYRTDIHWDNSAIIGIVKNNDDTYTLYCVDLHHPDKLIFTYPFSNDEHSVQYFHEITEVLLNGSELDKLPL